MADLINTKTNRDRLTPRREPYWARLRGGLYVGFRRTETDGHWLGRLRGPDGRQRFVALGPDLPDFDTAAERVIEWAARPVIEEKSAEPMTVRRACALYVEHQRLHKSDKAANDSAARFRYMIDNQPIGAIALVDLKAAHILDWVKKQVAGKEEGEPLRKAKDSANRQLSSFKAALNFAHRMGLVPTDAAWRAVTPFRAVGRRRQGFVPGADRERLLHCAEPDIRAFITALLLTAARPGEIAGARACDFDREQGTLALDGKTGPRTIVLSSAALTFFRSRAEFKIGNALLFTTTSGSRWKKETWGDAFDRACAAAELSGIVLYSIRHTAISEFIAGGMDVFVVARMAGTSTAMIDKHYGWLRVDKTRDALDRIQLLSVAHG